MLAKKAKKIKAIFAAFLIAVTFSLCGCGPLIHPDDIVGPQPKPEQEQAQTGAAPEYGIPAYAGNQVYVVNNNMPFFREDEMYLDSYEQYSELDFLGRCGSAMACVGMDIMPTQPRGDIGGIKPTGWHNQQYGFISSGGWLYNRCHLIAHCLTGQDANEKNLITGTRALNEAMIPYETEVADHVEDTNHHVMYRVTPIFEGNNLLAGGVLMEARCTADAGCTFCVYVYNVQPGVYIDYLTGNNRAEEVA